MADCRIIAQATMRRGAGPYVFLRLGDHSRPHGIELNVADCIQKVACVERRRKITTLPKVALPSLHAIDALRVLTMYGLERAMQVLRARRNYDEVYVIRHEAVRNDVDRKPPGMLSKQIQIRRIVAATEENLFAVITPLRDVMGYAWKDNTCMSWHTRTLIPNTTGRPTNWQGK